MITLKYDDYPNYPKLKTSNSAFQNGGLSYHLFEEDYTEVYGDTHFDLGFYTFDLIFTLIYLRKTSTIHDHAYANLTPLTLQFEIKENEVVVYLPHFQGNLGKDDNWGDDWEVNTWSSHRKAILKAAKSMNIEITEADFKGGVVSERLRLAHEEFTHPDDFISDLLNDYLEKSNIDLSFDFISKYLTKNLKFENNGVPIPTRVVAVQ